MMLRFIGAAWFLTASAGGAAGAAERVDLSLYRVWTVLPFGPAIDLYSSYEQITLLK